MHDPFRDNLSSVGWDLLLSTHTISLKCLWLPATKKRRATPNVKIFVLNHPLGDLGVTYTVHLWLAGKRVVDFLLAIIEFFSLALTATVLLSEMCLNQRFPTGGGSNWAQILGRWGRWQQSIYGPSDRRMSTTMPQRIFVADLFRQKLKCTGKK